MLLPTCIMSCAIIKGYTRKHTWKLSCQHQGCCTNQEPHASLLLLKTPLPPMITKWGKYSRWKGWYWWQPEAKCRLQNGQRSGRTAKVLGIQTTPRFIALGTARFSPAALGAAMKQCVQSRAHQRLCSVWTPEPLQRGIYVTSSSHRDRSICFS